MGPVEPVEAETVQAEGVPAGLVGADLAEGAEGPTWVGGPIGTVRP